MRSGPDIGALVNRAIQRSAAQAGCPVEIMASRWSSWASATFNGARHHLTLSAVQSDALDRWLAALPEAEIDIRGHLVADIEVRGVSRSEDGSALIELEVLTLSDA